MKNLIIYSFLVFYCVAGCTKNDPERPKTTVLAIVRNDTITDFIFKEYINENGAGKIAVNDPEENKARLNQLIEKKLIVIDSYEQQLNLLPEISFELRAKKDDILYNNYVNENISKSLVTEEEIKQLYENLKEEVKTKQILIKYVQEKEITVIDKSRISRFRIEALRLADSLYKVLSKEPSLFGALAEQFSDDSYSKYLGGDIGFIRIGDTDSDFEKALFSLQVGEISKPIETKNGIHILMVEKRRAVENLKPFEEAKEGLIELLIPSTKERKSAAIRERETKINDSLLVNRYFDVDRKNAEFFLDRYSELRSPDEIMSIFEMAEVTKPLATYKDGQIQIIDVLLAMKNNKRLVKLSLASLEKGLKSMAAKRIVSHLANQLGYKLSPHDEQLLINLEQELMHSIALRNFYKTISVSDEEVSDFYEKNKDNFRKPTLLDISEISSDEATVIDSLANLVRSGAKYDSVFQKAARLHGVKVSRTGLVPYNPKNYIMRNAVTMNSGENSEPFRSISGFSMVKLNEMKVGEYLSYEKIKPDVILACLKSKRQIAYNEWIANLSAKYKVQIFSDRLKEIFDIKLR